MKLTKEILISGFDSDCVTTIIASKFSSKIKITLSLITNFVKKHVEYMVLINHDKEKTFQNLNDAIEFYNNVISIKQIRMSNYENRN